LIEEEMKGEE